MFYLHLYLGISLLFVAISYFLKRKGVISRKIGSGGQKIMTLKYTLWAWQAFYLAKDLKSPSEYRHAAGFMILRHWFRLFLLVFFVLIGPVFFLAFLCDLWSFYELPVPKMLKPRAYASEKTYPPLPAGVRDPEDEAMH